MHDILALQQQQQTQYQQQLQQQQQQVVEMHNTAIRAQENHLRDTQRLLTQQQAQQKVRDEQHQSHQNMQVHVQMRQMSMMAGAMLMSQQINTAGDGSGSQMAQAGILHQMMAPPSLNFAPSGQSYQPPQIPTRQLGLETGWQAGVQQPPALMPDPANGMATVAPAGTVAHTHMGAHGKARADGIGKQGDQLSELERKIGLLQNRLAGLTPDAHVRGIVEAQLKELTDQYRAVITTL